MKTPLTQVLATIFTALAVSIFLISGTGKLLALPPVVELLTKMGVADHLVELGIMEISFAGLYLLPATRKLGFLLMSSYFSGALAVELAHSSAPVALGPLVLVWLSAFLRDRSMFIVTTKKPASLTRYPYDRPVIG
jgi:hypothetical protein